MIKAMSGGPADRVPTMPQICHPHTINILCDDYRKGIVRAAEEPAWVLPLAIEIAERYRVDGLRLFVPRNPVRVVDDGESMIAFDPKTGERLGRIDIFGGGGVYYDTPPFPVETADDLGILPRPRTDDLLATDGFVRLREAIEQAHAKGLFVASSTSGFTMDYLTRCRGSQQALMDLVLNGDLISRIMDVALAGAIECGKALVACGVDALYIGDASSSGSLISPKHFEQFCFPRYRVLVEELHRHNVLIYLHICGNSRPILEMMADTGVDCIEPLDPLGGVSVADAKQRVGHRVALMGGVNTLTILQGTPERVYEEALACCRAGAPNGGYILAAGDMVPDFSPEENVNALVRAARDSVYS